MATISAPALASTLALIDELLTLPWQDGRRAYGWVTDHLSDLYDARRELSRALKALPDVKVEG